MVMRAYIFSHLLISRKTRKKKENGKKTWKNWETHLIPL